MTLRIFTSHVIMVIMAPYLTTKTLFALLGTCRTIRRGWYFDRYMKKLYKFERKQEILKKARQWRLIFQWDVRCKETFDLIYDPSRQDLCMFLHKKIGKAGVIKHLRYDRPEVRPTKHLRYDRPEVRPKKKAAVCPACCLDICSEH
jgi:hypothetical protein